VRAFKGQSMSALLNQQVLVLNRLWQAVNICTVRRALTLLFQGHAQVVLGDQDGAFETFDFLNWHDLSQREPHAESIHGVSCKIRVPRVIMLMVFDRLPRKEVKFTRHNIFERDSNTCQYCGKVTSELTIDHVVPRHLGGKHEWTNVVAACPSCNHRKGGRPLAETGMNLLHQPAQPPGSAAYVFARHLKANQEWNDFLNGW